MIFTLGGTESYDRDMAACPGLVKRGRYRKEDGSLYPGGSVWRTRAAAEEYRSLLGLSDCSAYGVLADWEEDTAPDIHGRPFRNLLRDAPLVRLTDCCCASEDLACNP